MTMTIWERVANALASLTIPVSSDVNLQATATIPPTEKPQEFVTYSLIDSPPEQSADDVETLRSYLVQVNYFNKTSLIRMPDIKSLMVAAGFVARNIIPIPYEPSDGYFGVALEYRYLESED